MDMKIDEVSTEIVHYWEIMASKESICALNIEKVISGIEKIGVLYAYFLIFKTNRS